MKFQTILNEYSTHKTEPAPEDERLPSSSEISEMVTDADDKEKLSEDEQRKVEMMLEKIAENLYKKQGNTKEARTRFTKEANKVLSKYGIKLK